MVSRGVVRVGFVLFEPRCEGKRPSVQESRGGAETTPSFLALRVLRFYGEE